jgi:Protein of unknown function (DUF2934)
MAETLEARIRERAYHIWEASGRPSGRDEEFWHRACEMVASDDCRPKFTVQRRKPKQAQAPQPHPKRSRRTPQPASSEVSTSTG